MASMFWIIIAVLYLILVVVFFDSIREHPLGSLLLLSSSFYFLWRAHTFLTGAPTNDELVWKILGATAAVMLVVGTVGALASRRRAGRK